MRTCSISDAAFSPCSWLARRALLAVSDVSLVSENASRDDAVVATDESAEGCRTGDAGLGEDDAGDLAEAFAAGADGLEAGAGAGAGAEAGVGRTLAVTS